MLQPELDQLKRLAEKYWGKARPGPSLVEWHPLVLHCLDVASVAAALLEEKAAFVAWASKILDSSPRRTTRLLIWLAMLHDLGKFAENFQFKAPEIAKALGLKFHDSTRRHDEIGLALWKGMRSSLIKELGGDERLNMDVLDQLIRASCSHHGTPADSQQDEFYAFSPAAAEDAQLFARLAYELAFENSESEIGALVGAAPDTGNIGLLSWHINGLMTVADWIGSDTRIFPYVGSNTEAIDQYWRDARRRGYRAVVGHKIGHVRSASLSARELVFGAEDVVLRPLQSACEGLSLPKVGPSFFILEDSTGSGKTEAALILAVRQMQSGLAEGIFFALPTMATANGMYRRIEKISGRFFLPEGMASLVLSHGQAKLMKELTSYERGERYEESASEMASAWLSDHRKVALLAHLGIGTIDQVLLGILRVKHLSLRLFGLFRKVLIVDEVHAYDAYQHRLLRALIEVHAASGGQTILLSATLPSKERGELVQSFVRGQEVFLRKKSVPPMGRFLLTPNAPSEIETLAPYPCITNIDERGITRCTGVVSNPDLMRSYAIDYRTEFDEVVRWVVSKAEEGHCVAWVRNTVKDASIAYEAVRAIAKAARLEVEPEVFHARFALVDRIRIENDVLKRFGNQSGCADRRGRILIATQVIEQSLDLDFDYMISDLAPIDLLIQRAGRLRRHRRDVAGDRLPNDQADQRGPLTLSVFGPTRESIPENPNWLKTFSAGTAAVYEHHGRMWLTAKVLGDFLDLKNDPRGPIEAVYSANEFPAALQSQSDRAEGVEIGEANSGAMNQVKVLDGFYRDGSWASEERIPTRLGEESVELVLACVQAGEIVPYATTDGDESTRWALSVVRMLKKHGSQRATLQDSRLEAKAVVLEALPRFKFQTLCILNEHGQSELGVEEASPSRPRRQRFQYSKAVGWHQTEDTSNKSN